MATVIIEIKQTKTLEEGPVYRVDTEVLRAQNIDQNIFVFETVTDAFSHVAVTYDMQTYPDTKAQAEADGVSYYRSNRAIRDFDNESTAVNAAAHMRQRIQGLAREYQTTNDEFLGSSTYTYAGDA